jgi:Holliday junction resolvase-like predicted endonuclease
LSDLVSLLTRKLGSPQLSMQLLEKNREELGVECEPTDPGLVAMSLCSLGVPPEDVSSLLSWKEFESFCADLLRSAGLRVCENVRLRKPIAQIDIVAEGTSVVLSVDCKHWKRGASASALAKVAEDQNRRNELLRKTIPDAPPIISVIITLAQQPERFASGAAVVPLFALRSFLNSIDEYLGLLVSS